MTSCPTCGTELTLKSKSLLIAVGLAMLASIAGIFLSLWLVLPAGLTAIVGAYLILWATRGKALWCRTCKKAPYL
jgi:ABC-type Mn2+/Zn2+ transport system permease subunit